METPGEAGMEASHRVGKMARQAPISLLPGIATHAVRYDHDWNVVHGGWWRGPPVAMDYR